MLSHRLKETLVGVISALALGCGRDTVPVPAVEPFRTILSDTRLGTRLADLKNVRPGIGVRGDGSYWEEFRDYDVAYGFWPKEVDRPPPLSARLVSIEGRRPMYDTTGLWTAWNESVAQVGIALEATATCMRVTGGRTTIVRAEYPGRVSISVAAELWRGEDGVEYGAFLITRAQLEDRPRSVDDGMEEREIDCGDRFAW